MLFICVLCTTAATACEVEFDFKDLDGDPLFLIDGTFVTGWPDRETCNLQMYLYAVPSAAGNRDFPEEARCTLRIYRNGELIDTKDEITVQTFYGLIADNYPAAPGDEILVTAESEGFPVASSRSVIPQAPPGVEDISCIMEGGILRISFAMEDDAATDDAYAFCFKSTTSMSVPDDGDTGINIPLSYELGDGYPVTDAGPFDISWKDGITYYGVFDDSFSGKRRKFEVTAPFEMPSGNEDPYFRIEIRRISPERLRYETACADKGRNILGFIGLAPVTFAYTNVTGGSGCFSSGNVSFSPWMKMEIEK